MSPYQAAFDSAAVFDLRDRAMIELSGKDAREFLHNLCTQDVKNLPVGQSREAFLTTNKARVIAHVWIWHRKPDVLLLDVAGSPEKLLQHLNHYLISEQVEIGVPPEFSLLRVIGPKAKAIVAAAGLTPAREQVLPGFASVDVFLGDADGDELVLRERLLDVGATSGDAGTFNILRIEAGWPEFGIDIDEERLAMEVNRPSAISYTKGCYLGQETIVMARDRGQVNRKLMGVRISTGEFVVGGRKVFRDGAEVGQITSSVFSPRLQCVIALAYLRRGSWDAGTEVVIEPTTDGRTAVVCALPFLAMS